MSLRKIIYLFVLAGVIFNAVFLVFYQINLEKISAEGTFGSYFQLDKIGDIFISIASVLCFYKYRKYYNRLVSYLYVGMLIFIFIASVDSIDIILNKPIYFYSTKGFASFINLGLLFFTVDKKNLEKVKFTFLSVCIFFIFLGLFRLSELGSLGNREVGLYAVRELAINVFWICTYFFIVDKGKGVRIYLLFFLFFCELLLILAIAARSYLFLMGILLIYKINIILKSYYKHNRLVIITVISLVFIVSVVLFINSSFYSTYESMVNLLSNRLTEDSRSSQLSEFLNQFEVDYLLLGVGPFKTWNWSSSPLPYQYLDNQFLLLIWWAGLPCGMCYIILLIRSFLLKPQNDLNQKLQISAINFSIGYWILACLGFAIYAAPGSELYNYFITLIIGLNYEKKIIRQS